MVILMVLMNKNDKHLSLICLHFNNQNVFIMHTDVKYVFRNIRKEFSSTSKSN